MVQSNHVRQKYDSINNLDDLGEIILDSKDGETPWLEFKTIKKEKGTQGNDNFVKQQKSFFKVLINSNPYTPTSNSAPFPTVLLKIILYPCLSAKFFAIARPNPCPEPSSLVLVLASSI